MQYYNGSMYGCSGDSYSAGTVQGFVAQTDCLNNGPGHPGHHDQRPVRQAGPGPARPDRAPAAATCHRRWSPRPGTASTASLKGLMTWSINWDGSKGWTFGDNVKSLQGR